MRIFFVVALAVTGSACSTDGVGLPNVTPSDAGMGVGGGAGGGGRGGTGGTGGARAPDAGRPDGPGVDAPIDTRMPDARPDTTIACTNPAMKRAMGQPCACASECASGFCVDGVCCNTACGGTCRACNVPTSVGMCSPIPAGMPPLVAAQCQKEAPESCGFDGTCDGAGACRKYPDGTTCAAGRCQGSEVTGAKTCKAGQCATAGNTQCAPYACDTANNRCFSACTTNTQCDGRTCTAGSCGKKPIGASCGAAAECDSNFCTDGVCCAVACTGACVRCNAEGRLGQCVPVAAGNPDPHDVCKKEAVETCGYSGLCNGMGGCSKYAPGTVCQPSSCSGGSQVPAGTCNGTGTCIMGTPITCFPYICSGNACKATCASSADCASPNTCANPGPSGSCGKKGPGQACAAASECKSTFCVDGVCCDNACTGSCKFCNFPNSPGRCVNVPASTPDPRRQCQDRGPAACGTNGACNGSGACQTYANGTVCRSGSCDPATNRYSDDWVCDNGVCEDTATGSCAPYRCNGPVCATSCSNNSQCSGANTCQNGECGRKPNGAVCTRANECSSGFCAHGICCSTACTASCFACNLPGSAGVCRVVPNGGVDPTAMCKDQGPSSCGNDGTCNGSGGCRKYAAGTICAAPTCAMGTATAASTCNGAGTCVKGSQRLCSPYVCNGTGTDCFSSCAADSHCIPTRRCELGMCGRKDDGSTCASGDECKSGFCVDGVCCNNSCTGLCRSCAIAGSTGTCSNIPAGQIDPAGGCAAQAQSTCGNDGTCNGMGACRKWGPSTVCRAASCPAGSSTLSRETTCDGNGTCPAAQTQSCGTFVCDSAGNVCKTICTTDMDCVAGRFCVSGSCGKKPTGAACTGATECDSGNCVDGACCAAPVCGTCQTCASGTCQNVPNNMPDPDSCSDTTGTNTCGTIGVCNGNGQCKHAPASVECGQTCSGDNSSVVTKTCDGDGMCAGTGNTQSCGGYLCMNNACSNTCDPLVGPGCIAPKVCIGTACVDPPPPPEPEPEPQPEPEPEPGPEPEMDGGVGEEQDAGA